MSDFQAKLIDTLRSLYGKRLFAYNAQTYPVIVLPAAPSQRCDVDSVLAADYPRAFVDRSTFAFYDSAHLEQRLTTRPGMTDNPTYIMERMQTNPLRIQARLGRYFDMMATCDALDWELRDFASGERGDLPLRQQLHAAVSADELLYDGRGRSGVIGVAVLTVFVHDGGYRAIVARRSSTLATGAGLYHVVPAFVFQPSGPESFYAAEWSIRHHVCREFGEELFAMSEYGQWPSAQTAQYFYDHPAVANLRAILADGRAELLLTGVAFNLLSTRPEICAALLIHDPEWYTRSEAQLQRALSTERQETRYIPIDTLEGLPDDLHIRMTPQGAAALWLGLEAARARIAQRSC
jgi:hypothetical protein